MGYFGADSNWEIGYAMGKGKLVRIFIDDSNRHLLDEYWLLYGGLYLKLLEVWELLPDYLEPVNLNFNKN